MFSLIKPHKKAVLFMLKGIKPFGSLMKPYERGFVVWVKDFFVFLHLMKPATRSAPNTQKAMILKTPFFIISS